MPGFLARARDLFFGAPVQRANGVQVHWPSTGGDRGPPGEWQARGAGRIDDTLFAFGAVYAAIQIISGDAAKLPVVFYDIAADGTRTLNRTYPTNALMLRPNNYQNRMQFIQAVVISYLTAGNVYILKRYDARGLVKSMHVLDPRACWPYVYADGSVYYRVSPNLLAGLTESAMIPARDIGHIRLQFSPAHPLVGVSPIYAAAASSEAGQRILFNAQKFFANGAKPGGVLSAPGRIADDTAKRLREDWDSNFNGTGTGRTAVLGEGLTFSPIAMTAVDAQMIEQLRWSVEDVARVFRVPPFMIGDQSKVTYRNSEQLARTYLNGCLSYHLSGIVLEFNSMFGFGSSMTMDFDLDFLLKTEIDVRYDANSKALNAGWKTINEVRRGEGLPAVDYGDDPLVQAQMRTLESVVEGTEEAPASAPPAAPAEPAEPAEPADSEAEDADEAEKAIALPYRGTWDGATYRRGEMVTHAGALWCALRETAQRPGDPGNATQDWRLAVKRGASGANGKTPVFSMSPQGVLSASYAGEEPIIVGDFRALFQETVDRALKSAGVSNG